VLGRFETDEETDVVVMVGEIGGGQEEKAAPLSSRRRCRSRSWPTSPAHAPPGATMGHAGAIISGTSGTAEAKKEALEAAGVRVGTTPTEVAELAADTAARV
jgi:succinyl-CoA synthetase alpha subunit